MSEAVSMSIIAPPKPAKPMADVSADRNAIAHVEKWMALIREISREPVKTN